MVPWNFDKRIWDLFQEFKRQTLKTHWWMVVIFASLSWLILTQRQRERDQDRDKIGFYNITWKFSHCNLSCTCTHTFALYRLSFLYGYFTQPGSGSSPHTISTKGNNIYSWNFSEDISLFCEATDTPVLDLCWRLPWISKPGWIPGLCASSSACNGFLRFIYSATPADLLTAEPFWSIDLYLCIQAAQCTL